MSVDAFGIHLGPLYIRFYGILIVTALLTSASVAAGMAKRSGKDPDHIWGAMTWMLIPGILGARLWFVLFPPVNHPYDARWYLLHPFDIEKGPLAIWSGGLSIWGALLGGLLGVYLYARRYRLNLIEWLDIGSVVLPLGQAIGRWGNFVNRELYGVPTDLPWGIEIPARSRVAPYTDMVQYPPETRFHPLFLYESLWDLASFGFLYWLWAKHRDKLRSGDLMLIYLVLYPLIRFLLEFIRVEQSFVGPINVTQAISLVSIVGAAGLLLYRHRDDLFGGRGVGAATGESSVRRAEPALEDDSGASEAGDK